ncbi:MAG TPA: hypothetical protein VGF14_08090 [Alphaproteobacteria bacterium]
MSMLAAENTQSYNADLLLPDKPLSQEAIAYFANALDAYLPISVDKDNAKTPQERISAALATGVGNLEHFKEATGFCTAKAIIGLIRLEKKLTDKASAEEKKIHPFFAASTKQIVTAGLTLAVAAGGLFYATHKKVTAA